MDAKNSLIKTDTLKGLADYAEAHGSKFRRIDAITEIDGRYRLLDMQEGTVRDEVRKAASAKALYESKAAADYEA